MMNINYRHAIIDFIKGMDNDTGEIAKDCYYSEFTIQDDTSNEVFHVTLGNDRVGFTTVDITYRQINEYLKNSKTVI